MDHVGHLIHMTTSLVAVKHRIRRRSRWLIQRRFRWGFNVLNHSWPSQRLFIRDLQRLLEVGNVVEVAALRQTVDCLSYCVPQSALISLRVRLWLFLIILKLLTIQPRRCACYTESQFKVLLIPPHFTENLHTALAVSAAPSTICENEQDLNAITFTALHSRKPSTAPAIPSPHIFVPFPQSCIPRLMVLTPASEPRRICFLPSIQPPPLISAH